MKISLLSSLSLRTSRLALRPVRQQDLNAIYHIQSQARVNRFIPYSTWTSHADAQEWFDYVENRRENEIAQHWVILQQSSKMVIGHCLAFNFHADSAQIEIGYVLDPSHEGHGFMYEAMCQFISSISAALALKLVTAMVQTENQSSIKLLDKLGFSPSEAPLNMAEPGLLYFVKSV